MALPNGPDRPSDSSKPPAKGASLGRPGHKGFIPPRMHREKVEVTRAEAPPAPIGPEVQDLLPAVETVSHATVIDATDSQSVPTPVKTQRKRRRPLLQYYGGGVIAAVSILLAAFTAGIWVHSLGAIDRAIYATSAGEYYWIESVSGALYFHSEHDLHSIARQLDFWRFEFGDAWAKKDPPPAVNGAAYRGIRFRTAVLPGEQKVEYTVVSYWLLVGVLALPSVWWLSRRKRLGARCRQLRCPNCGKAMPYSQERCSACGTPASTFAMGATEGPFIST